MEKVSSYTIEKITNKLLGKRVNFISDCELFPNFNVNVQVVSISISPNKEVLFDCRNLGNRKKLIIGSKMKNLLQLHFYAEKEGKKHASLWVNLLCGSLAIYSLLRPGKLNQFCGSNPPSANFYRLLCSVYLPQKVRGIFGPKTQKTGLGLAVIAIPKPVFSGFTVFWAISALKARKLPDLSGRQIRQLIWLRRRDLNPRPSGYEPDELPDCSTPRYPCSLKLIYNTTRCRASQYPRRRFCPTKTAGALPPAAFLILIYHIVTCTARPRSWTRRWRY